ncbi:hypothetical protein LSH36_32g08058 [Paralvinella palmiformis]|uniref:RING-type domain-containing protein n=1 Tax=Paralvinella palmiformis TaxID=53620 RepID=A0AAD9KAT3_9ANNE|nr:hypothetical protein LSH36_32g08058 [Paralvinella palmiformis]
MAENHTKDILLDLRSLLTCAICQEQLVSPRLLPCQHSFCLRCLRLLINSYSGDTDNPISCPSCRQVTFLMPSEAHLLPVDIKANQIAEIIKTHQSHLELERTVASDANASNVFDITASDSDLEDSSNSEQSVAELQWCEPSDEHIWDIDFMADGSVLCASSSNLRQLSSLEGCDMHLSFDTNSFQSPCSLAVSDGTIVIVDWDKGNNEGFLIILNRNNSDRWEMTKKRTQFQPNGVAITPTSDIIICGNDHIKDIDLLLCYDDAGDVNWCQTYPSDTLGPYIATDSANKIFISTPTKNSIDLYSTTGEHISKFQAEGVQEPRGLCFSSEHHLIIADQSNRKVSMFDATGALIEHLVDFPGLPNSVSLYEDRLLAVTDWQQKKLYMYELWK